MIQKLNSETIETLISNKSLVSYTHIIKELIDNSLDAKATSVVVKLYNNGLEKIELIDNGLGVEKEELKYLFDRSYTSKNVDNASIGFKGDALASLSNLAKVSFYSSGHMISKHKTTIETKLAPTESPAKGSKVVVDSLFSDYPVRLKYLRTHIKQNLSSLTKFIKEMSLVYPHISFQLYSHNTGAIKRTRSNNDTLLDIKRTTESKFDVKITSIQLKSIKHRIADVYSIDMLRYLKEVSSQTGYPFFGLFSLPGKVNSRNCNLQRIYINNNIAEFPKLIKLLNQLYKNSTKNNTSGFFFYIVNIFVDKNSSTDKFLSPLKDKVVLENEEEIIRNIMDVVRKNIFQAEENSHSNVTLTYSNFLEPKAQTSKETPINLDVNYSDEEKNKKAKKHMFNDITNIKNPILKQDVEETEFVFAKEDIPKELTGCIDLNRATIADFKVIGQFNSSFIICKYQSNVVVLDQHASDEIITYYRLLKDNRQKRTMTKVLLKKETVVIDKELLETAKENLSLLKMFGFSVSNIFEDQGKLEIDGISVLYKKGEALSELERILENIKNGFIEEENLYPKSYLKEIATTACRSSIMIGDVVNFKNMERIIKDLSQLDKPWNCPHGRPTMSLIKRFD